MRYHLLCSFLLTPVLLHAQSSVGAKHKKENVPTTYSNKISVSPLPLFALEGVTYFGIGIEYGRFLDDKKHFSTNAGLFGGMTGLQEETGMLFAFSQGFRYHPIGNTRKLDFSFGPQLLVGRQSFQLYEFQPVRWKNITALLLQVNQDVHAGRQGLIGLYTACGPYNDRGNIWGLAIQLGLKPGGRF